MCQISQCIIKFLSLKFGVTNENQIKEIKQKV